jgi:hypothetical protein
MSIEYPYKFTLEDGVHVEVRSTGNDTYDFTLTKEGAARHFTYVDDERSKDEKTAHLDFDELNALRAFWLKQHE